jgi:hypothetical protein
MASAGPIVRPQVPINALYRRRVFSDGTKAGSSYNSVPSQANYAQPYYGAPFILMENWK